MTGATVDEGLVVAAREGHPQALDELVARSLPLVYNIVGRALSGRSDVDDVVQETMLRVLRGLGGLRDGQAYRSWLVAVTMNQIRSHRQAAPVVPRALDELAAVPDPGADFADLTLTELGLSGQRRETVLAARWLDEDDQELLSLWWLVTAGHLSRAELVHAMGLDAHHVTVRVSRMKAQLDAARVVVRALGTMPRCPELANTVRVWDGRPSPLWRKRLARHLRECGHCAGLGADLVPAERLLVGFALVPLPLGYLAWLLSAMGHAGATAPVASALALGPTPATASATGAPAGPRRTPASHRRRPAGHRLGGKAALLAAVGVTAAVGAGVLALPHDGAPRAGAALGATRSTVPTATAGRSSVSTVSSDDRTAQASATPSASRTPSAAPSTSRPAPPQTPDEAAAAQVLAVINQARAAQGLAPLTLTTGLQGSSAQHNRVMAAGCGLSHLCPGEAALGDRESAAGVHWGAAGENIGDGGPVADSASGVTSMAVGLTRAMLAEQPPDDGHRRNILSPTFRHIGIAVVRDANGTVWLTQDFSD